MTVHVLLLAGTHEARSLAGRLWDMPGLRLTASLAGVTDAPHPIAAEMRRGGFGGAEGLAGWLRAEGVGAVIDATHPFAARMPWNAAEACAATATPRLRLIRPPWPVRAGWISVPDLDAAAAALPEGARVFLTTGRQSVAPFAARRDIRCLARSIERPGPLPPHITPLVARPPFTLAGEVALLSAHRITHLVTKNAGGRDNAKLDAAERLGLDVICVERPPVPPGELATDVEGAVAWLRRTVGFGC